MIIFKYILILYIHLLRKIWNFNVRRYTKTMSFNPRPSSLYMKLNYIDLCVTSAHLYPPGGTSAIITQNCLHTLEVSAPKVFGEIHQRILLSQTAANLAPPPVKPIPCSVVHQYFQVILHWVSLHFLLCCFLPDR